MRADRKQWFGCTDPFPPNGEIFAAPHWKVVGLITKHNLANSLLTQQPAAVRVITIINFNLAQGNSTDP